MTAPTAKLLAFTFEVGMQRRDNISRGHNATTQTRKLASYERYTFLLLPVVPSCRQDTRTVYYFEVT
jgi:hypothetical protein